MGITPAGAGKTKRVCIRRVAIQDHPRGCGENFEAYSTAIQSGGSPPRMRGKLGYSFFNNIGKRITPADAGKTCHKATLASASRDHPRGCGENTSRHVSGKPSLGSPPRMRGKRGNQGQWQPYKRITPADAGKTLCLADECPRRGDHPRGCGENSARHCQQRVRKGSPPRMRGKPLSASTHHRVYMDHPRGCGENIYAERMTPAQAGSPPRMRGKLFERYILGNWVRITPADAGKTYSDGITVSKS